MVDVTVSIEYNTPMFQYRKVYMSLRVQGVEKLINLVESMINPDYCVDFDASSWVHQWIEQPLPALNNTKPMEYMDTIEGQELVINLLMKMQSGAYA